MALLGALGLLLSKDILVLCPYCTLAVMKTGLVVLLLILVAVTVSQILALASSAC